MTISGHNLVMKSVRIAELKSRLSEHLRSVKKGETIEVFDRETPIAQIVPLVPAGALRIQKPLPGALALNKIPLPKPLNLDVDVVEILLEERQNHR